MKYLLLLSIFISTIYCQQPKSVHKSVPSKKRIQKAFVQKDDISDSIRNVNEQQAYQDSIRERAFLKRALIYAKTHVKETSYNRKVRSLDSFPVNLVYGYLFNSKQKHLMIYNETSHNNLFINIYLLNNGSFKKQISIDDWLLTYTDYKIVDVNGDGIRDFVFRYYPLSGCCARDVNEVYLSRPSGGFEEKVRFLNPNFYPKEKVVRGVEYGHSGQVPLYKFKWRGKQLDTIEYIYPADTFHKNYYRVNRMGNEVYPAKRQKLNRIPIEYRKTNGYEWFNDY